MLNSLAMSFPKTLLITLASLMLAACGETGGGATPTPGAQQASPAAAGATTPLHEAAAGGHLQTVNDLARGGANVNALDETGKTPLHRAAANGHGETVSALLELGADPSVVDEQGHTARYYAEQGGHSDTAGRLPAS